jgi:hypothetical protein
MSHLVIVGGSDGGISTVLRAHASSWKPLGSGADVRARLDPERGQENMTAITLKERTA